MPFSFRLFLECIRYCDWSIAQVLSIHSLHSCIRCLKTCKVNECKTFGVACFRITHYLKKKTTSGVNTVHTWRILHGCAEIHNFPSTAKKYFTSEHSNELPNHFTLIVFWCERRSLLRSHSNGDIFTCEDNMLFSHVKIPSFHAKAHLVFDWCFHNK